MQLEKNVYWSTNENFPAMILWVLFPLLCSVLGPISKKKITPTSSSRAVKTFHPRQVRSHLSGMKSSRINAGRWDEIAYSVQAPCFITKARAWDKAKEAGVAFIDFDETGFHKTGSATVWDRLRCFPDPCGLDHYDCRRLWILSTRRVFRFWNNLMEI